MAEPTRGEAEYIKVNPWKQKEAAIRAKKKAEEEAKALAEAERLAKLKEKKRWKPPKKTGQPVISPMSSKFGGFSSYVPPPKKKKPEPKQEPVKEQVQKTPEINETEVAGTKEEKQLLVPQKSHKEPTYVSNNPWKKRDRVVEQTKTKEPTKPGSGTVSNGNSTLVRRNRFQSKGTEDALAVISKSRMIRKAAATNTMRESTKSVKSVETVKSKSNFANLHNMLNKTFGHPTEEDKKEPEKPKLKPKKNGNFANMHAMLQGQFGGKASTKEVESKPKPKAKKLKNGVAAKLMAKLIGGKKLRVLPAGDPEYEKYEKMKKRGLPEGAIRNCLERDGLDPEGFYNPVAGAAVPIATRPKTETPIVKPAVHQQIQAHPATQQRNLALSTQPGYQQNNMAVGYNHQMPQQQMQQHIPHQQMQPHMPHQQMSQQPMLQQPMPQQQMPHQPMQQHIPQHQMQHNMPQQQMQQHMPQQQMSQQPMQRHNDQNFNYNPSQQQQMPYQHQQNQEQYQQMHPSGMNGQYAQSQPQAQYQNVSPPVMQQYPQQNSYMQQPPPPNMRVPSHLPPSQPVSQAPVGAYPGQNMLMSSSRSVYSTQSREPPRSRQGNTLPSGRPTNNYEEYSVYRSSSSSMLRSRRRNQNTSSSSRRSPTGEFGTSMKNSNPRYAGNTSKRRARTPHAPRVPPPGSVVSRYSDGRSETGAYIPTEPIIPPPPQDFDDTMTVGSYRTRDDREFGSSMRQHPRQASSVRDMRGTFMNTLDDAIASSDSLDKYGGSRLLSKDISREAKGDSRKINKTKRRKGKPKKKGKGIIATLTRRKKKKPLVESYRSAHSTELMESFSEVDLSGIKEKRSNLRRGQAMNSTRTMDRDRNRNLGQEEKSTSGSNEWSTEYSDEYNRPFYVNQRTGERTWVIPKQLM